MHKKSAHNIKKALYICAMLSCTSLFAQYKWVEQGGKVVYSDSPPPASSGINKVDLTPFVKTTTKTLPIAQQPTKPAESVTPASSTTVENKKSILYDKQACEQLQGYLKILQDGGRIAKLQSNGERSFLDEKARQQEIIDTQRRISEQCKKI
jgi:hypothetical protein